MQTTLTYIVYWTDPHSFNCNIDYGDKDKQTGKSLISCGTGTVYHFKDGIAYIITCAHNVVKKDHEDNLKYPLSVEFLREVSKYCKPQKYDAEVIAVHNKYMYKNEDDELAKIESNDLAIIRIKDTDGFYQKIFAKNSDVIYLSCSDHINDKSSEIVYNLYGYPCVDEEKANKHSKANDGELWSIRKLWVHLE